VLGRGLSPLWERARTAGSGNTSNLFWICLAVWHYFFFDVMDLNMRCMIAGVFPALSNAMTTLQADELIQEGLAASAAGDSSRALDMFAQASAHAPGAGLPHFLRGSEFAGASDMARAEEAFSMAVLLAPELTIARYQLGLLQFSSARVSAALLTWEPLRALPYEDPLGHFVQGFTSLATDDFAGALAAFERGLACNTSNAPLSDDIRKVMQGVQALQQSATPRAASVAPEQDSAAEHVLLSNYQRQGTLH
jgi:tetratricopeptide (TPR) repeat protein